LKEIDDLKKPSFIVIFITCPTDKEAKKIAGELLHQKKVACVNIIPRVDSFFWWQGKIDSAKEVLLVAKSEAKLLKSIVKLVLSLHSYKVPEIIALPIIGGHKEYLKWISKNVKE